MDLLDFQYDLPPELIARYPLPKRSSSRLMRIAQHQDDFTHGRFTDLLDWVMPGDLMVLNDTKVILARLMGRKETGGKVEILIERVLDERRMLAQVRSSKPLHIGQQIFLTGQPNHCGMLVVTQHTPPFYEFICPQEDHTLWQIIETIGQVPLPPYLHRNPEKSDIERYQTIYARYQGSVAAPTAGLHFDAELLRALEEKKVEIGYLTLHVGSGTFAPVRVKNIQEHRMHAEYVEVSNELCHQIIAAKQRGNRVIAVGTTTLRALETASRNGTLAPYRGETNIFIYPGHVFLSADVLITNLHLPGSTLIMLVSAFGGHDKIMRAYQEAVSRSYRFYSYGDAMWVEKLFGA